MNDPFGEARLSHMSDGPVQIRLWPFVGVVFAV